MATAHFIKKKPASISFTTSEENPEHNNVIVLHAGSQRHRDIHDAVRDKITARTRQSVEPTFLTAMRNNADVKAADKKDLRHLGKFSMRRRMSFGIARF